MENSGTVDVGTLGKFRSLSSLPATELEKLSAAMSVERFGRREKIFEQDEEAPMVYFLVTGIAKLTLANQQERSVLVSLIPPGEFFGIGSLFPQKRHPFSAEAFSECTAGVIEPGPLIDALLGIPFQKHLVTADILMGRIWNMFLHCIRGIGLNLRRRLALELLELAASFGVLDPLGTALTATPTHEDLASAIGASRQKVSQCMAEFERRRIIRREGRRLILDPHRLRRIIDRG